VAPAPPWRSLARSSKRAVRALADATARRAGFDLVRRSFYSPLPDRSNLPDSLWSGPSPLPGVDLGEQRAMALLTDLAPHLSEFRHALIEKKGFRLENGTYESVDAETLYGTLRHIKPSRVIELGSGTSSHIIAEALKRNEAEGTAAAYRAFDPYPWEATELGPVEGVSVAPLGATEVPPATFESLGAGDVLFVDTTHTVKTGGDVPHLFCDVVPTLAPGVLIHFHDIFLPYEYPRGWVIDKRLAWAEQYLLQAFLAFNPAFEVILPVHALARSWPDEVRRLIPSFRPGVAPGAFWIRRRELPIASPEPHMKDGPRGEATQISVRRKDG
jgi:predicted O-methyltransferase YrrM